MELVWYPQRGYGKAEGEGTFLYAENYWAEFRAKQETAVGKVLTRVREGMVKGHLKDQPRIGLVDIGIGGGAFVEAMDCKGFDINPVAIDWLKMKGSLWDEHAIGAMTFWDSIEHMANPLGTLNLCEHLAFISTPIYKDAEHCLNSKHLKMPEHLWYFTGDGLCRFMSEAGFVVIEATHIEQAIGRTDIGTYAFQRVCYP